MRTLCKYKQEHEAVPHLITYDALAQISRATDACIDALLILAAVKSRGCLQPTYSELVQFIPQSRSGGSWPPMTR